MHWLRMILLMVLCSLSSHYALLCGQTPPDEISPLPFDLAPARGDALRSISPPAPLSTSAAHRRLRRYFFRPLKHPLTPRDVALRESVRALGTDHHRFVHCELKDRSVVTGAIASIGEQQFFVRTGIMGNGRTIHYKELNAPPRPVAAVGAHLKNGLEISGLVGLCVVLSPLVIAFYPLVVAGVIQD